MNAINLEPEIDKIYDRFKTAGVDIEKNIIKEKLESLIKYRVPLNEAVRTVTNTLRKERNLPFESFKQGNASLVPISSIKEDNKWVTVKGKVLQLWEPRSDTISQTGLIGDESGAMKFTIFAKSADKLDITLEEGKSYEFRNVVSSIWQEQVSLKINSNSEVVQLEEEIEVGRQSVTVTGIITSISAGSGLIKRCPECRRKLSKGSCGEHGRVEGVFDLRLKACLQDSVPSIPPTGYDLIINAELVEKLTGISLDKAKEMATEALDTEVVTEYLSEKVLFRYYKVTGAQLPGNFLVEDIEPIAGMTIQIASEVKKLLAAHLNAATGGV